MRSPLTGFPRPPREAQGQGRRPPRRLWPFSSAVRDFAAPGRFPPVNVVCGARAGGRVETPPPRPSVHSGTAQPPRATSGQKGFSLKSQGAHLPSSPQFCLRAAPWEQERFCFFNLEAESFMVSAARIEGTRNKRFPPPPTSRARKAGWGGGLGGGGELPACDPGICFPRWFF